MRILYGVVGEGMGHAVRSRVVIDHLSRKHEVHVVVSGRAYDYLQAHSSAHLRVSRIWGLSIVYEDNEVQEFRTVLQNLKGAVTGGWPKNVRSYFEMTREFQPDAVVSDFESWSYLYGKVHQLPIISLDNMHVLARCTHAPDIIRGHGLDFEIAKGIVEAKLPGCQHYLITTFFFPPLRVPRTSLHPPVLRPQILGARSESGDHLLVYQTSESNEAMPAVLAASGRECRIYGFRRGLTSEVVDGRLRYRPFSERDFVEDLRTARAVIANGGFTLLGEAVYLHKPVLALPVKKQFEQELNARYLEAQGYGMAAEELDAPRLGEFLERLPHLEEALALWHQDGNRQILTALDGLLSSANQE